MCEKDKFVHIEFPLNGGHISIGMLKDNMVQMPVVIKYWNISVSYQFDEFLNLFELFKNLVSYSSGLKNHIIKRIGIGENETSVFIKKENGNCFIIEIKTREIKTISFKLDYVIIMDIILNIDFFINSCLDKKPILLH